MNGLIKDEVRKQAVSELYENLLASQNYDSPQKCSYADFRQNCSQRFKVKHLFRASKRSNQLRKSLADFFENYIDENQSILAEGFTKEDFENFFAPCLAAQAAYRIRLLFDHENFQGITGNTLILCIDRTKFKKLIFIPIKYSFVFLNDQLYDL